MDSYPPPTCWVSCWEVKVLRSGPLKAMEGPDIYADRCRIGQRVGTLERGVVTFFLRSPGKSYTLTRGSEPSPDPHPPSLVSLHPACLSPARTQTHALCLERCPAHGRCSDSRMASAELGREHPGSMTHRAPDEENRDRFRSRLT